MSAEYLRETAAMMREDIDPLWRPVALLLENTAEDADLLSQGGDLGPEHDTMMQRIARVHALAVARTWRGDSA